MRYRPVIEAIEPPSPEGEAAEPTTPTGNILTSAQLVAAGILLSRIAGLVREKVLAHYFGTSLYASAFRAALRMPNVLQNLLGEGTLSSSFIPVYARLLERGDKEAAGRLAGAIFALLLAVAGALALFGFLLAPILVSVFFPKWDGELREVTIACARIIFPMTGVLVLSAWALGILNSHRKFFVSYFAPVMWNAAMIAVLLAFAGRLEQRPLIIAVAWGALLGGALQFLVQLPWVLRLERELRLNTGIGTEHVRTVLRNAGPAILGRGVVQVSGYADLFLAGFLFEGAVAAMGLAQTLYILPVSLFGMSIAAAELPELSRSGSSGVAVLRTRINAGLRQMAVFVVPSVIGYLLIGDYIVDALYRGGEFRRADTLLVYAVLAAYSLGLFASTATRLYASGFYALNDTRTPAKIALVRVLLAAALGGALMLVLERYSIDGRRLGVAGLAAGAGMAAWVEWILVRRALARRIGDAGAATGMVLRLVAAAVLGAAAARGTLLLLPTLHYLVEGLLAIAIFGLAYFAAASIFRVAEVRSTLQRVFGRFGSRLR